PPGVVDRPAGAGDRWSLRDGGRRVPAARARPIAHGSRSGARHDGRADGNPSLSIRKDARLCARRLRALDDDRDARWRRADRNVAVTPGLEHRVPAGVCPSARLHRPGSEASVVTPLAIRRDDTGAPRPIGAALTAGVPPYA